jgi:thiol-disulfide isomerase/thioredoxin
MKKGRFILAFILFLNRGQAQERLEIGDKLPDFIFSNLESVNKRGVLNREDNIDKVLIIDFWSTWCGSCIKSIPKIQQYQQKYQNQAVFLLITREDSTKVKSLFNRLEYLKGAEFMVITNDTIFNKLFPHQAEPHIVWVNRRKIVCAITGGEHLFEENVNTFVKKDMISLPSVVEIEYSPYEPLEKVVDPKKFLLSSTLTKGKWGLSGRISYLKLGDSVHKIVATNTSLLSLYTFAWRRSIRISPHEFDDRVLFRTQRKELFAEYSKPDEFVNKSYCYELVQRFEDSNRAEKILLKNMQLDLDRSFQTRTSVQITPVKAYIIQAANSEASNKGPGYIKHLEHAVYFHNQSPATIATHLNLYEKLKVPILYEGSNEYRVSVLLQKQKIGIEKIKELLKQIGLELTIQTRYLPMLVIDDW